MGNWGFRRIHMQGFQIEGAKLASVLLALELKDRGYRVRLKMIGDVSSDFSVIRLGPREVGFIKRVFFKHNFLTHEIDSSPVQLGLWRMNSKKTTHPIYDRIDFEEGAFHWLSEASLLDHCLDLAELMGIEVDRICDNQNRSSESDQFFRVRFHPLGLQNLNSTGDCSAQLKVRLQAEHRAHEINKNHFFCFQTDGKKIIVSEPHPLGGWLLTLQAPSVNEVKDFYSEVIEGHKSGGNKWFHALALGSLQSAHKEWTIFHQRGRTSLNSEDPGVVGLGGFWGHLNPLFHFQAYFEFAGLMRFLKFEENFKSLRSRTEKLEALDCFNRDEMDAFEAVAIRSKIFEAVFLKTSLFDSFVPAFSPTQRLKMCLGL